MCYGDPSATEVPPCCETATKKLTFSTTSVLLLLNMPLSLSRATIFRRQKNPRRVYRPKIAGILFVCNEPEGKYYTVPNISALTISGGNHQLNHVARAQICTGNLHRAINQDRYILSDRLSGHVPILTTKANDFWPSPAATRDILQQDVFMMHGNSERETQSRTSIRHRYINPILHV